jgi:hypothetical protein
MTLQRTFVSFSSADIKKYYLMCAWKANEHIDFNFADFQLDEKINSSNPSYIKSICRNKINRSDTFILLIGDDTWKKTEFVKYEVEAAIEKGCRLIGVNLNNSRKKDYLCPDFFKDKGALFVPFSPKIIAKAFKQNSRTVGDWSFEDNVYLNLGYELFGNKAVLLNSPNPFTSGKPTWVK